LSACLSLLESSPKGLAVTNAKAAKVLFGLVSRPLEHFSAVLAILQLSSWPPLLAHLSFGKQKEVAAVLVGAVIAQGVQITASADAGKLLAFVNPLMLDDPDDEVDQDAAREKAIDEDTAAELGPVSRLIHAFSSPSTDDQCRILNATHRQASNAAHRRSPFALVPVVFACLPLARAIKVRVDNGEAVEVGVHKLLSFVATIIQTLVPLAPILALRLCLLSAHVADTVGEEGDAYEFFTQAFTTYEEAVSESRAQLAAVTLACATLHHTKRFDAETYDTLATKTTQYSARLLKKPDQCRAVVKAALLFASNNRNTEGEAEEPTKAEREPRRVLECLQRALKIADSCKVSSTHTPLFVEILDAYLFHFEKKNTAVLPSYLSSLLQLIEQQVAEESAQAGPSAKHFANCQVRRVAA
jgi:vacuolar protein sorting-associated protein 35